MCEKLRKKTDEKRGAFLANEKKNEGTQCGREKQIEKIENATIKQKKCEIEKLKQQK